MGKITKKLYNEIHDFYWQKSTYTYSRLKCFGYLSKCHKLKKLFYSKNNKGKILSRSELFKILEADQ